VTIATGSARAGSGAEDAARGAAQRGRAWQCGGRGARHILHWHQQIGVGIRTSEWLRRDRG